MNRRSILPNHYGYNVFNPITIDVDGPFGLAVCQPSTVPRPFIGVKNSSTNSSSLPNHKIFSQSIEKSMNNLQRLDEVEEIYAECGENCGTSVTCPESNYGSRKMSTMPRPFASVRCHSPNSHRRSFSVDMQHSISNMKLGPHIIMERYPNNIRCNPENKYICPSIILTEAASTSSKNKRKKSARVRKCLCIVGSHIATILFTLLSVAGNLHITY
jgi:hypothetical protein